ncbi:MAG TPA: flagellar filament capping protein FliD, partial [Acidimicrobiales bacterium]|nr:flagellar filament capping protein FliD [Acidimicrobiales bacterium]
PPTGSTSSSQPPVAINGLVSGIDTTSVINALMTAYQQPQVDLQNQQSGIQSLVQDWQAINSKLAALQTAADAINTASNWDVVTASSSNTAVATATGGSGATTGSISFTVNQLAAADTLASSGSVSSTSAVVTTASDFLLSQGGSALGFTSLASGSGLSLGSHTVKVTQASAAASTTGSVALAPSTTITAGVNDTFNVTIDGVAYTYTLSAGTYTPAQLAAAVASASGGSLTSSVNGAGELLVGTTEQGSAATLQITGGTALGSLGLSTMGSTVSGVDGVVSVDGTSTTLTSLKAGASVSLASGSGGSISAVLGGGVSTGTVTATDVSTGNGSLSSVVSAINNAGTGITATAVQTGSSSYVLQLAAKSTGVASNLSVDSSAFASSLGTLNTVVSGADAKLSVGGAGGYTVDSASNAVTGLLPGVTVNLLSTNSSPVTITSSPDATTMGNDVQALVTAANGALSTIQQYAGYNASTKQGGPLLGNPIVAAIQQEILGTVASAVGPNGLSSGSVGVNIDSKTGQIDFTQSTFTAAYQANPSGVTALFSKGGTFAPAGPARAGDVSLLYAPDAAKPGAYNLTISQSAAQATDAGAVLAGGSISGAETLTVQTGGSSVNYAATAGATLASIATGLNAAFASSNLGLTASVINSGQQLQITSNQYGSAAAFSVTSTATGAGQTGLASAAGVAQTFTGTDVAGTINGVAATGSGQVLSAPESDPTLAGLSLLVTTSGVTTSTSLGTFTYTPGLAGGLGANAWFASNPINGSVTTTIQGLQNQSTTLGQQISSYDPLIAAERKMLEQQFQSMETQLGNLKSQGDFLSSQIAQLPTL